MSRSITTRPDGLQEMPMLKGDGSTSNRCARGWWWPRAASSRAGRVACRRSRRGRHASRGPRGPGHDEAGCCLPGTGRGSSSLASPLVQGRAVARDTGATDDLAADGDYQRGLVGRVARGDVEADAGAVRVLADGDDGALAVDAGHWDAVRAVFDGGGDDPGWVRASAGAGQDLRDRLQSVLSSIRQARAGEDGMNVVQRERVVIGRRPPRGRPGRGRGGIAYEVVLLRNGGPGCQGLSRGRRSSGGL
jgi:hypothetical protein